MMTVKSLFVGILFFLISISLSAQSIAIKGGLNFSKTEFSTKIISPVEGEANMRSKYRTGLNLGITNTLPVNKLLSLETGLIYQERGFITELSYEELGAPYSEETKAHIIYLDVPFTLKANFDLGNFEAYAFGGGYLGIGLGGQGESTSVFGGVTETLSGDVEFGEDGHFNRLDYGALFGVGLEFNSVFIEASYGLGLSNIIVDPFGDETVKNRLISVSAGYQFNY